MNIRKMTNKTRRNVTIDTCMANDLETMASFTGFSQGELIEVSFSQPIMQRLRAYVCPSDRNPLVELLETYQIYEGHMSPRIGEGILNVVKWWVKERAVKKYASVIEQEDPSTNEYIYGHMPKPTMEAAPYMRSVYEQAKENRFVQPDMDAGELKSRIVKYIDVILAAPLDRSLMGESYLFRNLLILLTDYFEPPVEQDVKHMFHELSDGFVLPYFSSIS